MPTPSPYGSSGLDLYNTITQAIQNRQVSNPALGGFGRFTDMSAGSDQSNYAFTSNNNRLFDDGTIKGPNGSRLFQVGGDSGHYVIDPSRVTHDDEFGDLTDQSNLRDNGGTFFDRYGGWLLATPALYAAGAAAIGGAGTTGSVASAGGLFEGGTITASGSGTAGDLFAGGSLTGEGGTDAFAGGSASASGGSNILSQVNQARQYLNYGRTAFNLLSGGQSGRSGMPTNTGDSNPLGDIGSILGLLGLGRSTGLFGGGVGTPSGAVEAGNRAADRSDPWGASGGRAAFSSTITPDNILAMLGRGPGGFASAIQKDPAYQNEMTQGIAAVNQGDAAQGTLRSGNRLTELQALGSGLTSKYENDYFQRGLASAGLMSGLAGAGGTSNPTAAGQDIISGFTGGTNLQNAGANGLFGGAGAGAFAGLGNLLSSGGTAIGSWLSQLFGGGDSGSYSVLNNVPNMSGPGAFDGGDGGLYLNGDLGDFGWGP